MLVPLMPMENDEHAARQSQTRSTSPPFCQNGAKSGFEMCFGPSTLGAGAKTRLHTPKAVTYHEHPHYCRLMIGHSLGRMESRIKKFTPHRVCRPRSRNSSRNGSQKPRQVARYVHAIRKPGVVWYAATPRKARDYQPPFTPCTGCRHGAIPHTGINLTYARGT